MKVLIINSTLERSGLTNAIFNIARYSLENGVEMHVLTLSPEPPDSRMSDFEKAGVNVHSLQLGRIKGFFYLKESIRKKVEKIAPDIIHTHSFRGSYYAAKYLKYYPRMVTIHAVLIDNYKSVYGDIIGKYIAGLELKAFKKANSRTVISNFLAELYFKEGKSEVIRNGADPEIFFPVSRQEKQELRLALGLPLHKVIYIFAADLVSRKDPFTLLEAFKLADLENSILVILGDGPLKVKCKAMATDSVLFAGKVSNVDEYFKAADVFVSTSLSEGQGLSALEAAMCGLPCLLSDLPVHKEYFGINNNQQSYFFERQNVNELTLLIKKFPYPCFEPIIFSSSDSAKAYFNAYHALLKS